MSEVMMFPILPTGDTPGGLAVSNNPHAGGWQAIGTFDSSDFAASSTYTALLTSQLNAGAKERSFVITNGLNVAITDLTIWMFDSSLDDLSNTGGGQNLEDTGGIAAGAYAQYTSEDAGILAFHGDSMLIQITIGSTAPTSGSVVVNVNEFYD